MKTIEEINQYNVKKILSNIIMSNYIPPPKDPNYVKRKIYTQNTIKVSTETNPNGQFNIEVSSTDSNNRMIIKQYQLFPEQLRMLLDRNSSSSNPSQVQYINNNGSYSNITNYWNINDVCLYDPGVRDFSKYPTKKADGVICIDVVEHIPEDDVINFIEELFKLANKFVFIVIACYPAKKTLPDGRNVHLCIKSADDWKKIIKKISTKFSKVSPYVICATNRKEFVAIS